MISDGTSPRLLRSDAADNRARILAAAAQVLAERGGGGDVREIARLAGVGTGTVYRHFATKRQLVEAVLADVVDGWVAGATEKLTGRGDPWCALRHFMEDTLARQADNRGLLDAFRATLPSEQDIYRASVEPIVIELVEHAKAAGSLRSDVTADDIALLLLALGRTIELFEDHAPGTWRRGLSLTIDGLRPRS